MRCDNRLKPLKCLGHSALARNVDNPFGWLSFWRHGFSLQNKNRDQFTSLRVLPLRPARSIFLASRRTLLGSPGRSPSIEILRPARRLYQQGLIDRDASRRCNTGPLHATSPQAHHYFRLTKQLSDPQYPSLARQCQAFLSHKQTCRGCRAGLLLHPTPLDAHFTHPTPFLPRQTFPSVGRVPFLIAERSATCLRFAERSVRHDE